MSVRRIATVESHAGGEPLRLIVDGLEPIPGATILDKRRWAREHLDGVRRALMWEPRGHADMYGAIVTEPATADGDLGVLFMHNEGWSTMCGHGIIALVTVLLETGIRTGERLRIDTPAGRVTARAIRDGGRVREVAFENVPSFVVELDARVDVPGLGEVRYDLAFGGAFYAFVDADALRIPLEPSGARACIEAGMRIKRAVMSGREIRHPDADDLSFLYGTILCGAPRGAGARSRNVCVFADGEVDRSPTGTGVSARVAIETARGRLAPGDAFVVESIVGSRFTGRSVGSGVVGRYAAVIPEISGSARVIGRAEWTIDPDDEVGAFLIR